MMMMMMMMTMFSSGRVLQNSVVAHPVTNLKLLHGIGIFAGAFTKCHQWLYSHKVQFNPHQIGTEVFLSASSDTNG